MLINVYVIYSSFFVFQLWNIQTEAHPQLTKLPDLSKLREEQVEPLDLSVTGANEKETEMLNLSVRLNEEQIELLDLSVPTMHIEEAADHTSIQKAENEPTKLNKVMNDEQSESLNLSIQETGKEKTDKEKKRKGIKKEIECPSCGKKLRSSLETHMRTHTKETPYSCLECKKNFTQQASLINHIRIHTGEKLWKCSVCEKSFGRKGTLNEHIETHCKDRIIFNCPVCNNSFKSNKSFKFHMKKFHNQK